MEAEISPKSNIALARKKSIYQAGNAWHITNSVIWNCGIIIKQIRKGNVGLFLYSTWYDTLVVPFLDPGPTEDPIKSPLSVRPSVRQLGVFLRDGWLVFSDFWYDGR